MFSEQETDATIGSVFSLKSIFVELYSAYKNNLKLWWELKALENYIENIVVPKGLRINITPAGRSCSPELLARWEEAANNSSIRFMTILLEEEKKS